jgi:hypothetical protein
MEKILEIEKRVFEKGISCEWQLVKSFNVNHYVWRFQKNSAKCEFFLSSWDLNKNTENVLKLVFDYFENYKLMVTYYGDTSPSLTEFCCFLTGHDEFTIKQMYEDWSRHR